MDRHQHRRANHAQDDSMEKSLDEEQDPEHQKQGQGTKCVCCMVVDGLRWSLNVGLLIVWHRIHFLLFPWRANSAARP